MNFRVLRFLLLDSPFIFPANDGFVTLPFNRKPHIAGSRCIFAVSLFYARQWGCLSRALIRLIIFKMPLHAGDDLFCHWLDVPLRRPAVRAWKKPQTGCGKEWFRSILWLRNQQLLSDVYQVLWGYAGPIPKNTMISQRQDSPYFFIASRRDPWYHKTGYKTTIKSEGCHYEL